MKRLLLLLLITSSIFAEVPYRIEHKKFDGKKYRIELFCSDFGKIYLEECINDMIQCLTDDVFTFNECADEYLEYRGNK